MNRLSDSVVFQHQYAMAFAIVRIFLNDSRTGHCLNHIVEQYTIGCEFPKAMAGDQDFTTSDKLNNPGQKFVHFFTPPPSSAAMPSPARAPSATA